MLFHPIARFTDPMPFDELVHLVGYGCLVMVLIVGAVAIWRRFAN